MLLSVVLLYGEIFLILQRRNSYVRVRLHVLAPTDVLEAPLQIACWNQASGIFSWQVYECRCVQKLGIDALKDQFVQYLEITALNNQVSHSVYTAGGLRAKEFHHSFGIQDTTSTLPLHKKGVALLLRNWESNELTTSLF